MEKVCSTTILCIRGQNKTIMIGDGQATLGNIVLKSHASKVKYLGNNKKILSGFAGASADAFALYEHLEKKLELYSNHLKRACIELAKDWRMDKFLRKLEAMMIVADSKDLLLISGTGEVIEPDEDVIAIGSGGCYALAAARAILKVNNQLDLGYIAETAMQIASDLCIYTNSNFVVKSIEY